MKKCLTLLLAAGLVFSAASSASAIDFKAQGEWLVGFAGGQGNFVDKTRTAENGKKKADSSDRFTASQRVRLQLDAVASESLSGTVFFEIGDQTWGSGGTYGKGSGGAMGADGVAVEVKNAYIDWMVPDTTLSFRMGIQALALPNVAGGSAVLDDDAAGVTFHMQFNENVGLTGMWARPLNDNYDVQDGDYSGNNKKSYLDNVDLFALTLPLTFDGIEITSWAMLGVIGQNAFRGETDAETDITPYMTSNYMDSRWNHGDGDGSFERTSNANTTAFWAGLPVKLTLWDPLNIEFDINYGYVGSQGRGTIERVDGGGKTRFSTERQGWLAKALVEYKMDWGTPGIFGWYASGDDDNPKNGSERMPSVSPSTNFTSFMGDGNLAWSSGGSLYDRNLSLAGTWGIGLQVADMSFVEDLKHTFRIAYWGGTNSPTMAKYAAHPWSWESGNGGSYDGDTFAGDPELYLTTNDGLLEFNLVNSYQMYENFEINFELGYIVNFIDHDTWKKANRTEGYDAQDAWKAQLIFAYTF